MTNIPNRRHNDPADPAAAAALAAAQSEQQVRARAAFLFRDAIRQGQLHPLMPLLIRHRLQWEAP